MKQPDLKNFLHLASVPVMLKTQKGQQVKVQLESNTVPSGLSMLLTHKMGWEEKDCPDGVPGAVSCP